MKTFKKVLSVLIITAILMMSVVTAFAADGDNLTFLYIDKGNIVIGDGTVSGYGYFGEHITEYNPDGYCIAFSSTSVTSTKNTVVINGGENYILLKSVTISVTTQFGCAFMLQNGAAVTLDYTGINTITSGRGRAGIEVSPDCTLILNGEGTLKAGSAGQAGIGGGSGNSNGTIIINSGTIVAQCKEESAGIGGGSNGNGGNIIINGGNVTAKGGSYAAGIGGGNANNGGNITINGGTVTATGGIYGAGIGGGWYGEMGNVVINGGSVKSVGGESAPSIGAGSGITSDNKVVNSENVQVYPVKFSAASSDDNSIFYFNGTKTEVCGKHADDSYYYFYLPQGVSFISVENENSPVTINKINVLGSSFTSQTVTPVQALNGAEIGSDNIIRGISCGLKDLNDYLTVSSEYTLSYDNDFIGTGTGVTVMYGTTPVYKYRTLLYGDVNNDGFYNGEDSVIVKLISLRLLNSGNTDSIVLEAADADRSGYISDEDVQLLENAGLLFASVSQGDFSVSLNSDSFEEYLLFIDQTPYISSSTDDTTTDGGESQSIPVFDFILRFIKIAIKILTSSVSFFKNYYI